MLRVSMFLVESPVFLSTIRRLTAASLEQMPSAPDRLRVSVSKYAHEPTTVSQRVSIK